jgi:hypothetical protein
VIIVINSWPEGLQFLISDLFEMVVVEQPLVGILL